MNRNEYKEAVNKIVISDELKEKLIRNSSEKKTTVHKKSNVYSHIYRAAGLAACFVFCAVSYYAVTNYSAVNTTPPPIQTPGIVQSGGVPNNTADADTSSLQENISRTEPTPKPTKRFAAKGTAKENKPAEEGTPSPSPAASTETTSPPTDAPDPAQEDFPPLSAAAPSCGDDMTEVGVSSIPEVGASSPAAITGIGQEIDNIKIPHYVPDGYESDGLSMPFDEFAQIIYTNGTDKLYYRTAKGSEDISGDYNEYSENETVVINDNDVTIKGNDNLYHNATWHAGDETFAIYSNNGIEKDTIIKIAESVY